MKNYSLISKENLEDIKSEGYLYRHKSGAKVIYIDNNDEDRVFSICFKTLPKDNTGAAHIMEHCVLCGSKKFPIKDPFNELDKGSLNTYLNAITFFDKTLFPISSTNEKDFYNLMEVYLDAVFFPLIYERKGIFLQEGWHKAKSGINGVVYNEMLGSFSEPEQMLDFKITEKLFCDTDYKYYSGGLPEFIPNLSYEKFLEFHKMYYHPSNSIIYIYGKNDIKKCFEFIDKNYLSKFNYKETETKYDIQHSFDSKEDVNLYYDEDENIIGASFITGFSYDFVNVTAMNILCNALFNSDASPVKNSLISSGICTSVDAYIDDDMYQSVLSIKIQGSKEENTEKFKSVLMKSLNEVYSDGIDKKLLEGCILNEKFYLAEEDFGYKPKGLFYNLRLLQSFVYSYENFDGLNTKKLFDKIKNIDFLKLLKEMLIENKYCVYGILKKGKNDEKIKNYDFIKCNEDEFLEYQNLKDKKEDIEKIPHIKLSEISENPFNFESHIFDKENIIFNPIKNNEIIYINIALDTSNIPENLKQYLGIYRYLLSKMNTLKYNFKELNNEINYYFGCFEIYFSSYLKEEKNSFFTSLNFEIKSFKENRDKIFKITKEIIFNTNFSDLNRIKMLLKELKIKIEDSFYTDGNSIAALRCLSYFNASNRYNENIRGIKFYDFLCEILNENKLEEVKNNLLELKKYLLRKENVILSFSSDVKLKNDILSDYKTFYDYFSDKKSNSIYLLENKDNNINEGFILNSDVNYNVMAADYFKSGYKFSGKLQVINKIIASDYLWNKVRAENGAYGANLSIRRNGVLFFSSYRDPKVENTFCIYKDTAKYLDSLKIEENDIKKYIIGTINILDRPVKDNILNEKSLFQYYSGVDYEKLKSERAEILSFKSEDIKNFSILFDNILKDCFFCSIGNENDIKSASNYFNNFRYLKN